jgi:hypothetical protein
MNKFNRGQSVKMGPAISSYSGGASVLLIVNIDNDSLNDD